MNPTFAITQKSEGEVKAKDGPGPPKEEVQSHGQTAIMNSSNTHLTHQDTPFYTFPFFILCYMASGGWFVRIKRFKRPTPHSFSPRNNAVIPKISKHTHNHINPGAFASLHRPLRGEDKTRFLRRIFYCRTYNYSATTLPN